MVRYEGGSEYIAVCNAGVQSVDRTSGPRVQMIMKNSDLMEISLISRSRRPATAEILRDLLMSAGVPMNEVIVCERKNSVTVSTYCRSLKKIKEIQRKLRGLPLRHVRLVIKVLKSVDWLEEWKNHIKPFALTSRYDVVPVWHMQKYRKTKREPIYLDTTASFGTGLHETTRFMALLIERCRGRFVSFLDVGTGAGLLAIVAYKCAARQITIIDVDAESIQAARKNALRNGVSFSDNHTIDFKDFKIRCRYDFIAANLISEDLITLCDKIVAAIRPGKYLAVSGISLPNLTRVRRAFREKPLRCLKILRGKKWSAVLYQRIRN